MNHPQPKLVLTVPDAAKQLGIGRNTLYDAIKRNEIPSVRIGRRLLVPVDALRAFLLAPAPDKDDARD